MKGSEWIRSLPENLAGYDEAVLSAVRTGDYVLSFAPVSRDGVTFYISTDCLHIGEPGDSVRAYCMSSRLHDAIAYELDLCIPTSKMLDWAASQAAYVGPHIQVNGARGLTRSALLEHHEKVECEINARTDRAAGTLWTGYGKTYVLTPAIPEGKACNYGWHVASNWSAAQSGIGRVIQREGYAHEYSFYDYSQCAVFIRPGIHLDGVARNLRDVVTGLDARRVSVHGPAASWRGPNVGLPPVASPQPIDSYSWRPLRMGDRGPDVADLQRLLVAAGYDLGPWGPLRDGVDGSFGRATHNALISWQGVHGLSRTGQWTPSDREALPILRPNPAFDATLIPFVPAGSFGYRAGGASTIRWIVIHCAEAKEASTTAEALASWARGKIGVSWHYAVDDDTIVQCVKDEHRAYAAGRHGNAHGIHVELAGYARQTAEQWHDPFSDRMLKLAAGLVKYLCAEYEIPTRFCDSISVKRGEPGVTTHAEITKAYPDETTHTDPGPHFPMDAFLARVRS